MDTDTGLRIAREIVTHTLAIIIIAPFSILLYKQSQNPESVTISPLLISLASGVLTYYFGRYFLQNRTG